MKKYKTLDYEITQLDTIENMVSEAIAIVRAMQDDEPWLEGAKHAPHDRHKALRLEYLCNLNDYDPQAIYELAQDIPEMHIYRLAHGKRIPIEPVDGLGNVNIEAEWLIKMYEERIEANKRFAARGIFYKQDDGNQMTYQEIFTIATTIINRMDDEHEALTDALLSKKDMDAAMTIHKIAEGQHLDPDVVYDLAFILTQHDSIRLWDGGKKWEPVFDGKGNVIISEAHLAEMYGKQLAGNARYTEKAKGR